MAKNRKKTDRILLVEDDDAFAQLLAYQIEASGLGEVVIANDAFEAANQMLQKVFDLVVTDWRLPSVNGFRALRQADHDISLDPTAPAEWVAHPQVPVIVITACDTDEIERERRLKGRFRFLGLVSKAQSIDKIVRQIQTIYANWPLASTG